MAPQKRGDVTRSRILDAARDCFSRLGYDATGVAEICRQAGLSKGAFYHHFPSKESLFLELLNRWLQGLDDQLLAIRGQAQTFSEQLLRMAGVADQVFQVAEGSLPLFLEFWTKAGRDPAVRQAIIAPYRRYQAFFAEMIQTGIARGTLQPTDAAMVSHVIVSLSVGLMIQGLLDPQGADWAQVAQQGMRMLAKCLEKKSSRK
jgi:AcrR family transcriptional regulator